MKIASLLLKTSFFPDYDPQMQLIALRGVVSALRERSARMNADIQLNNLVGAYDRVHPSHGDPYADDCGEQAYFEAYLSSSVAACIAQFIEGVLRNEIARICYDNKGQCACSENKRFKNLEPDNFWEISCYYDPQNGESKSDIVKGAAQLLQALNMFHRMPENFDRILGVVFRYRNNVMHNGIEWPEEKRSGFAMQIVSENPDSFEWSTSGDRKWIAYLTDGYINQLLDFCGALVAAFLPVGLELTNGSSRPAIKPAGGLT